MTPVVVVVLCLRPSIFGSCLYIHFDLPWGTMDAPGAKRNGGGSCVSNPLGRGVSCLSSPPCESKRKMACCKTMPESLPMCRGKRYIVHALTES